MEGWPGRKTIAYAMSFINSFRREWFYLLSHEMFSPYYGLFEYSARYCVCMCVCVCVCVCMCLSFIANSTQWFFV